MIRSLSISIVPSSVVNLDKPLFVLVDAEVVLEYSSSDWEEAEDGCGDGGDEAVPLKFNAVTDSKETMNECFREWCTFLASWSSYRH